MNTVLAQSATQLTQTNHGEEAFPFDEVVSKLGEQKLKKNGLTRQAFNLNPQKLIASVCAEYRAKFAMIYGKSDRLPSKVFDRISEEVHKWIEGKLQLVTPQNAVSVRRSFVHKSKDMSVAERVTIIGENVISLQEQLLGINIFISASERRLKDLEAKPTPDLDQEKKVKERLLKLNLTKQFIQGEIEHQKTAKAE